MVKLAVSLDLRKPLVVNKPFICAGVALEKGASFEWRKMRLNHRLINQLFDQRKIAHPEAVSLAPNLAASPSPKKESKANKTKELVVNSDEKITQELTDDKTSAIPKNTAA